MNYIVLARNSFTIVL
uniref:Uncharacterized protein n=1 Tax=Arundo donax TaxID=35708 RepID=A0A0A9E433_ARUDO